MVFGYLLGGYWLLAIGCWLLVKSQVPKAKSFSTKFLPEPKFSINQHKMKNSNIHRSALVLLSIGLFFFIFTFSKCQTNNENINHQRSLAIESKATSLKGINAIDEKQRGAHIFGHLDSANLQPFIRNNFEWITLVSYGDQKDFDSPTMNYFKGDSLKMIRRDSAWKSQIDLVHSFGFKVFLKPHIWIYSASDGKWRSDIFPTNEKNWKLWQKNYREFILLYAKIAEQNNVELFCVGTELSRLAIEKADFWKTLIQDVRSIYSGKITYAANWYNEYEKITFWDKLDYIGIQAYFPLVENENPSVEQISEGWNDYFPAMEAICNKYNREILFTEMGYKSTTDSAIEPWQWIEYSPDQNKIVSFETQANCYEAFFNTVWKKDWFAGVHIWQLRSDYVKDRGYNNLDFTPQGKPAENIIAKGFE